MASSKGNSSSRASAPRAFTSCWWLVANDGPVASGFCRFFAKTPKLQESHRVEMMLLTGHVYGLLLYVSTFQR